MQKSEKELCLRFLVNHVILVQYHIGFLMQIVNTAMDVGNVSLKLICIEVDL